MPTSRPLPSSSKPQAYRNGRYDAASYAALYESALSDPEGFWARQASCLEWIKPFKKAKDTSFAPGDVRIRWYEGGVLNASANCLDRHLGDKGDKPAILWEPDAPDAESRTVTYRELYAETCRLANALESFGVRKGDNVVIYMPLIPEAVAAMLACARIGAAHSVVFSGFSDRALAGRIEGSGAKFVITADVGYRGGKVHRIKQSVDKALESCPGVRHVLVVRRDKENPAPMTEGRDLPYRETLARMPSEHRPAPMRAEDPLFVLYTSGSTGKPKGLQHGTGGYLVYASFTFNTSFDYRSDDVFWCTADVGWITGHTYLVYGPLLNGATTVMHEGVPSYPDYGRSWEIVDKYGVTVYYTAPTAIRALMAQGDGPLRHSKRDTLRLLGTVGEPINPAAWQWYKDAVGNGKCPIVDTWWQTETGGHLITAVPGVVPEVPGFAGRPLPGVRPVLVGSDGKARPDGKSEAEGALCLADSWPGQAQTIYGDHALFEKTYFSAYPGYYFSGDGAKRDADGQYQITGRIDDTLNVSGHRLGTAEIESALAAHPRVAEAAAVGCPHALKGETVYCYVVLNADATAKDVPLSELRDAVRSAIGAIAVPDFIQFAPALPKTRSGKIMRRILRKIAADDYGDLGDVNTLLNPEAVEQLIAGRLNRER
jgi:acetyl-CoA synthetase